MNHGGRQWRVAVIAGGDVLRQERLTRALHDELLKAHGLSVEFGGRAERSGEGVKGGGLGDVALYVGMGTAARPVSRVLITLIKEWCAKERHRGVELTYRGGSITIPARPDEAQERIIREFMERASDDEESEAE